MSTPPPRFFSFGIPPANSPPSCGGWSIPAALLSAFPWSLLLRARFPGIGGASPPGALDIPGTAGAPLDGDDLGPPETTPPPTIGADLSFVTAFLRAFPLVISWRRAPCAKVSIVPRPVSQRASRRLTTGGFAIGGPELRPPGGGGGGGGGPPIPGIGGGGGGGGGGGILLIWRWKREDRK